MAASQPGKAIYNAIITPYAGGLVSYESIYLPAKGAGSLNTAAGRPSEY